MGRDFFRKEIHTINFRSKDTQTYILFSFAKPSDDVESISNVIEMIFSPDEIMKYPFYE